MLTIQYEYVTVNGQTYVRLFGVKPAGATVGLYRRN